MRLVPAVIGLLLLAAAGPESAIYPLADVEGEALVVPAESPVAFARFEEHTGHFSGQFELTGLLVYGCQIECNAPLNPLDLAIFVIPDAPMASMLPHWKIRADEIHLYFDNDTDLARAVTTAAERKALLSGRKTEIRKRVALVVDDFRLGIDCDSSSYTARFVSLKKPAVATNRRQKIEGGCS